MKYIRYAFIAVLICCFTLSVKGIVAPEIAFTLADGTELNRADVDPQMYYAYAIAKYRTMALPWLAIIGLILCGWIFLSLKKLVFGVVATSVGILGYVIFTKIRSLGYTISQSLSAVLQGYSTPISGWTGFYLVALVALLIATMKKAQQTTEAD